MPVTSFTARISILAFPSAHRYFFLHSVLLAPVTLFSAQRLAFVRRGVFIPMPFFPPPMVFPEAENSCSSLFF